MKKILSVSLSGILFGAGLAASGMTDTSKVIGFLDVFGEWDPDLLFVMGAAVLTTYVGFKFVLTTREEPLFGEVFSVPTRSDVDVKLVSGASLFGVGWGLYGYCPGPAFASIIYLSPMTVAFLLSMFVGMAIGEYLENRLANVATPG